MTAPLIGFCIWPVPIRPLAVIAVAHVPQISVPPQYPSLVKTAAVGDGVGICGSGLNAPNCPVEIKLPMVCAMVCEFCPLPSGAAKRATNRNITTQLASALKNTTGRRRRVGGGVEAVRCRFMAAGITVGTLVDVLMLTPGSFRVIKGDAVGRRLVVRGTGLERGPVMSGIYGSPWGWSGCPDPANTGIAAVSAVVMSC